jgi:hypothetical protein
VIGYNLSTKEIIQKEKKEALAWIIYKLERGIAIKYYAPLRSKTACFRVFYRNNLELFKKTVKYEEIGDYDRKGLHIWQVMRRNKHEAAKSLILFFINYYSSSCIIVIRLIQLFK